MKIGLFTDTYYPQVSGVSTSIKILKEELERRGHQVVLFTTTDPAAKENDGLIRLPSIPFAAFEDRRIAIAGFDTAVREAKKAELDIVHTHTEFSLGMTGRYVASRLKIPTVHTYHTMYDKYTHYILNGELITAEHVRVLVRLFCQQADGVIVPSEQTYQKLVDYGVNVPMVVIPTGIQLPKYQPDKVKIMQEKIGLNDDDTIFLSLSRISKEKRIDIVIKQFDVIAEAIPSAKLVIVGDGPVKTDLEILAKRLKSSQQIYFTGEVDHNQVDIFYQMADFYLSASDSETQGLTYLEAIVNHTPVIAKYNDYLSGILKGNKDLGILFEEDDYFAQTVIEYVSWYNQQGKKSIDPALLYPISADGFGETVEAFYKEILSQPDSKRASLNKRFKEGIKNFIHDLVIGK